MKFSPARQPRRTNRHMRKILFILLFTVLAPSAFACEPCPNYWNLQDSLNAADLVIIGKRITPKQLGEDTLENPPEFVDIVVEEILKGKEDSTTIKAKAWSGMCPYGIVTPPEKSYVMLMVKSKDAAYYDSLNYGCAVSTLSMDGNMLTTRDGAISLDNFKTMMK
jgi:hypothetical protein